MGDYITIGESVFISLISMLVVFLILVLISILIFGLGFLKGEEKIQKKETSKFVSRKKETSNIPEEIIAVISATLLCIMDTEKDNIRISNIRKLS